MHHSTERDLPLGARAVRRGLTARGYLTVQAAVGPTSDPSGRANFWGLGGGRRADRIERLVPHGLLRNQRGWARPPVRDPVDARTSLDRTPPRGGSTRRQVRSPPPPHQEGARRAPRAAARYRHSRPTVTIDHGKPNAGWPMMIATTLRRRLAASCAAVTQTTERGAGRPSVARHV